MEPRFRKTRIAPTPSGFLHLGNACSFVLTAALARKTGARLLLRIDDLDQQRVRPDYVQDIFDTLRFLAIEWEEGPRDAADYRQHFAQPYRMELYRQALDGLSANGHVFACTCSRTQVLRHSPDGTYPGTCRNRNLPLDTPGASWRLHTTPGLPLQVHRLDGTTTAPLPAEMQHFIVRRKDGVPAYQLTSLVDDLHFEVDFIVRGADLWPSTLAQLYLATLLGNTAFLRTVFHHHALVTDAQGQKLSKSEGSESIRALREAGWQLSDFHAWMEKNGPVGERI